MDAMPIKPERRKLYPKDWPEISRRVRDRAGWRCEGSPAYPYCRAANGKPHPETGSVVLLTVGHLDHNPTNNEMGNLMAWCQRCHLTYDAKMHARESRKSRKTRHRLQMELAI